MTMAESEGRRLSAKARLSFEVFEGREAPGGWGCWDWASSWTSRANWSNSCDSRGSWGRHQDCGDNDRSCSPPVERSCGWSRSSQRDCTPKPPTCQQPPVATSAVGGFVYVDVDRDGFFSTGDTLLPNVAVALTNSGGATTAATTDPNGAYNFGAVAAGTYTISITPPGDFQPGQAAIGTFGGTPGDNTVTGINVVAGQSSAGYNFGLQVPRPR
jgi:SdrD B-like domain